MVSRHGTDSALVTLLTRGAAAWSCGLQVGRRLERLELTSGCLRSGLAPTCLTAFARQPTRSGLSVHMRRGGQIFGKEGRNL